MHGTMHERQHFKFNSLCYGEPVEFAAMWNEYFLIFDSNAYLIHVILLDGIVKHRVEIIEQIHHLQSTHNLRTFQAKS